MYKVAVIGLGRFGMVVARQIAASGGQVIAIDSDPELVADIKDDVDVAVRLDSTDEVALVSQEIDKVDICVVAIGENFEAALLTTVIAKNLGVPRVICRAQTAFHAEIFRKIGADEVIQPESQAGEQLARRLVNPHVEDFITLGEGFTLVELHPPAAFHNKTLQALSLRSRYGVNLVAIRRSRSVEQNGQTVRQEEIVSVPLAEDTIRPDDILVLVGSDEALARLPKE